MPDWQRGIRENLDLRGLEPTRQSEIVEDLAQQLDDAYRDGLARGMSDDQAASFAWSQCPDWPGLSRELRQSRRGAVDVLGRLESRACDAGAGGNRWSAWATVAQDLMFAVRMMRKAPTFTAAAVLTLALGIGANSTIFSVMGATFLKPLPFPDPDRLALIWETPAKASTDTNIVTAPRFWDWQRQNRTFERIALFDSAGKGYNLGASDARHEAEQVSGVRVTADFFSVLGVRPFLGREFRHEEETAGNDRVVVLGYGLWSRRYGSDRHLVGQPIRIDGESYTVVGVMPRDFHFQFWSDERELWVPAGWNDGDRSRNSHSFVAIGRLKPGVTVAQATADLAGIQGQLAKQYPEDRDVSATVTPMGEFGLENVQRVMLTLLAAVAFVLLIGCVNVANLMLARGAERRKEFAIRRAMGASSTRLARQLLAESLMLSALGGAAGLALAFWASRVLTHVLPAGFASLPMRPIDAVGLDARVLGFTCLITCVTGVVSGLVPALTAARDDVGQPLKEGGREAAAGGRSLVRHVLVASEVGLALVVLVAAGLLIKSMTRLIAVDPGFDPKNILTAEISVPQVNMYYGPPDHPRFCEEIEDRVASIPGVLSASAVAHLPLRGNAGRGFSIEGRPEPGPDEDGPGGAYTVTCPGYFRTLGVPIRKGREFTREDRLGSPGVVVVNEALARRVLAGRGPDWQAHQDRREGRRRVADHRGRGGQRAALGPVAGHAAAVLPALHTGRLAVHARGRENGGRAGHVREPRQTGHAPRRTGPSRFRDPDDGSHRPRLGGNPAIPDVDAGGARRPGTRAGRDRHHRRRQLLGDAGDARDRHSRRPGRSTTRRPVADDHPEHVVGPARCRRWRGTVRRREPPAQGHAVRRRASGPGGPWPSWWGSSWSWPWRPVTYPHGGRHASIR